MSHVDLLRDGLVRPRNDAPSIVQDDLLEWAQIDNRDGAEPRVKPAAMPTSGLCAVCAQRDASVTCHQCGRGVCAGDVWVMFGLCRECLTPDEVQTARTRGRPRPELGIKWIDDV